MATTIQLKRGNDINFSAVSLLNGEPAFVIDTGKLYIGDGTNKVLINPIDKISGLNITNTYTKFTTNEYGQIVTASQLIEADIPDLSPSKITGLGTAATVDVGMSAGNIPVLDANGKLPDNIIPSIALVDSYVVSSQTEMLALPANQGDVAIRTDTNENYILRVAPASALENWVKLLVPASAVTSVNGKQGVVVVNASDLLMDTYTKAMSYSAVAPTDKITEAIGKLEKNFDNFATLFSPTFTGTPTTSQPPLADSSAKIATTAFVGRSLETSLAYYAPLLSPTFTGIPSAPTPTLGDRTTKIATTAFVMSALDVIDGGMF